MVAALAVVVLTTRPIKEGYLLRFHAIAHASDQPYAGFPLEYPPILYGLIELLGRGSLVTNAVAVLSLSIGLDLGLAALFQHGWGHRATRAYLVLGTPLLAFLYLSLDLVPSMVVVLALVLIQHSHERTGGWLLGTSVFTKVWPLVLLPGLQARRATASAGTALLIGAIAWAIWSGPDGFWQVATQRQTPGWEVESTVGAVVWMVTGGPVRIIRDSPRVGMAPVWAKSLLTGIAAAWVLSVWARLHRRARGRWSVGGAASVGALLACSPIFSYPFAAWLLPWGALAAAEGERRIFRLVLAVSLLTGALHTSYALGLPVTAPRVVQAGLMMRNALVIVLALLPFAPRSEPLEDRV